MNSSFRIWLRSLLVPVTVFTLASPVAAEGISEPDLVLYGVVRNAADSNVRVTTGTLTWKFAPIGGGIPVTLSVGLTNINDQFSYVLHIPCESYIGSQITSNTLKLLATPSSYDRSGVTIAGDTAVRATLVLPALPVLVVSSTDRGRIEQVDLVVSLPLIDSDGDGIPDKWELAMGLDPLDPRDALLDYDGDGLNNLAEYRSGTNPNESQSRFEILDIQGATGGGASIRWSSTPNKRYTILRSTDLLAGFKVLQKNVEATPPFNTFHDSSTSSTYFYRLKVEE